MNSIPNEKVERTSHEREMETLQNALINSGHLNLKASLEDEFLREGPKDPHFFPTKLAGGHFQHQDFFSLQDQMPLR